VVRGTLGDLAEGRPLRLSVCDVGQPGAAAPQVRLRAGEHRISAPPTSQFRTVTVVGRAGNHPVTGSSRSIDIRTWSGTRRTAVVGPGPSAVLSMPENANSGWRATLAGKELQPVRVDGWQQAWQVPSGSGGRLEISYPPDARYRGLVIAGLVPAAFTVVAAVLLLLRRRPADPEPGMGRLVGWRRRPRRVAVGVAVVLLLALGGACAVGAALAWVGRRRAWPVALGGLAVLASGLLDATSAATPSDGLADLLAAAGFGLLFLAAVMGPAPEGP
jgi:arabinofuranan 3-O-arabinosyltransferase